MSMFEETNSKKKGKDLDKIVLGIRDKFGYSSIVKANNLYDKKIASTFDYFEKKEKNK